MCLRSFLLVFVALCCATKTHAQVPWFERLDLEALPKKAIEKDAKGRTWALFSSEILGNSSDLFIAEKKADGWGTPLFTGAWTEGRGFLNADAPKSFRRIPIEKLVATEWIKIFPDDPTLRKDSDGDGLTDLVEVRLGTNPKKADTDGDGLPDAIDPCPNAAPRVRGDTEQIISACLESWLLGQKRVGPVVLFNREVAPFELSRHPGQVLWRQGKKRTSWKRLADSGADEVFFLHPIHTHPPKGELVEYGPDRQTARIVFVPDGGGCIIGHGMFTLKKIDGEWFVVDWQKLSASWWAS